MSVNTSSVKDEIASKPRATMLCCECGTPIDGSTGLVMCYDCIKLKVDITEGIPRETNISFCRECERFLQPPGQWIRARLESRELLSVCLRRLKGLNKVRLIDASFIWTEPHSRRIKIKVTVQGEAMINTLIQQSFEVEYFVNAMQCPDCARSYTANTWKATVQIRQKVPHKRTFLYLEQMILKNNAHVNTISIKEVKDGLDFFYSQKNHAIKMVDFLTSNVPVKYKRSEELISTDSHTDISNYKFTYSVEIVPICKDDLVVLPKKLAKSLGNISQFVICHKISNSVQFLDPTNLQTAELAANAYWRSPFSALADPSQLVEFIVLDVETTGETSANRVLADVTVARAADLGVNDQEYNIKSHLGGVLHAGDSVMGYFIGNSNYNSDLFDGLKYDYIPDVVLVKKLYPKKAKKTRNWKLKRMAREHKDIDASKDYSSSRAQKQDIERAEKDYEQFLQDLEEDQDLRQNVNLYKSDMINEQGEEQEEEEEEEEEEEVVEYADAPGIDVDELLDEIDGLTLDDNKKDNNEEDEVSDAKSDTESK